jgi:hypothetical protein
MYLFICEVKNIATTGRLCALEELSIFAHANPNTPKLQLYRNPLNKITNQLNGLEINLSS